MQCGSVLCMLNNLLGGGGGGGERVTVHQEKAKHGKKASSTCIFNYYFNIRSMKKMKDIR